MTIGNGHNAGQAVSGFRGARILRLEETTEFNSSPCLPPVNGMENENSVDVDATREFFD